ncbi:winged helix-turn-helix transcriptional regulator [Tenacibaculum discolor]|uniref:winged helix-turn-helix transcriptional regulator n=1 Tax=Tenacibaculum discolor TaxID=361581 RepID=UPI000F1208C0|nr:helix-turn-helix domain-containing protein [Tenacibaculum discolor]RLJ97875.1 HxlR family transcriptional regulator [Tenacibaculum discolor]
MNYLFGFILKIITTIFVVNYKNCSFESNMNIPKPGKSVRGSKSGKPIMALFDLLGRNWTMSIIWYLNDAPKSFSDLEKLCDDISPTTLNTRLKELQKTFIIERVVEGYKLTDIGEELFVLFEPLREWSSKWSEKFN